MTWSKMECSDLVLYIAQHLSLTKISKLINRPMRTVRGKCDRMELKPRNNHIKTEPTIQDIARRETKRRSHIKRELEKRLLARKGWVCLVLIHQNVLPPNIWIV